MTEAERKHIRQVAHDLNTPLSAVSMQLFLRRRALTDPTPQEVHFLEILDRNVERIRILVASLLPPEAPPLTNEPAAPSRPQRRAPIAR